MSGIEIRGRALIRAVRAPDAALIDGAGKLHVFSNERQGQFSERAVPADLSPARAISIAELNNDSVLDLAVVRTDGVLVRLSDKAHGESWDEQAIVYSLPDAVKLVVADVDNKGGLDFVCGSEKTA